jgi:hypothetical protein
MLCGVPLFIDDYVTIENLPQLLLLCGHENVLEYLLSPISPPVPSRLSRIVSENRFLK